MNEELRQRKIEDADSRMRPGQFQHAARIYEELGMADNYREACFACSRDCFEVGLYALSVEYANKAGNKKLGDAIRRVCEEETLSGQCNMCEEGCLNTIIESFKFDDNIALEGALRHRGKLDLDGEMTPPCARSILRSRRI